MFYLSSILRRVIRRDMMMDAFDSVGPRSLIILVIVNLLYLTFSPKIMLLKIALSLAILSLKGGLSQHWKCRRCLFTIPCIVILLHTARHAIRGLKIERAIHLRVILRRYILQVVRRLRLGRSLILRGAESALLPL